MNTRKGIILAGGSGTRLYPVTLAVSKQLLPIYDKPMIYYPLSTLMLAGIREILIISTPQDTPRFEQLLGDGSQWGLNLQLRRPTQPGRSGAGLHHRPPVRRQRPQRPGAGRQHLLRPRISPMTSRQRRGQTSGATVFAYHVNDPERYGVVEFDQHGKAHQPRRKTQAPKSNYAVTGCISTTTAWSNGPQPQAFSPWRTGNHRRQYGFISKGMPSTSKSWAAACLAGYRYPRKPARSQPVRRHHRKASGPESCLP